VTFHTVAAVVDGGAVRYTLTEWSVEGLAGFPMAEICRLSAYDHQTAILTTRTDRPREVATYITCSTPRMNSTRRYVSVVPSGWRHR